MKKLIQTGVSGALLGMFLLVAAGCTCGAEESAPEASKEAAEKPSSPIKIAAKPSKAVAKEAPKPDPTRLTPSGLPMGTKGGDPGPPDAVDKKGEGSKDTSPTEDAPRELAAEEKTKNEEGKEERGDPNKPEPRELIAALTPEKALKMTKPSSWALQGEVEEVDGGRAFTLHRDAQDEKGEWGSKDFQEGHDKGEVRVSIVQKEDLKSADTYMKKLEKNKAIVFGRADNHFVVIEPQGELEPKVARNVLKMFLQ